MTGVDRGQVILVNALINGSKKLQQNRKDAFSEFVSGFVCLCIYWPGKNFVFVNHLTPIFCIVIISDCLFKTWTCIFGIEIMFRCIWVALFGILNAASSI